MKRIVNVLGKLNRGKRAYAVFVLCATAAIALPAQTFTTLHSFDGTDGASPDAGLVQATNGNFYGTTEAGGANGNGHGLQNHPERHADDALQLLLPKRMHGRRQPLRRAGPGHQWELLRDNV